MNVSFCIDIIFDVVVKEGGDICQLGRNKISEFINICQCLNLLENKYSRVDNLSKEHNFFLDSENPAMKIFKFFSVLEGQVV